jgi:GGDEF domain-containing protein
MTPIRQIIADAVYPEGAERRNRAERDAETDPLTGVGNFRALEKAKDAAETDPNISVLFIDGNDFGLLNKVATFEDGSNLIKRTARVLTNFASRVFRPGGDEFIVFVPTEFAEATRRAIEDGFGVVTHHHLSFTISCGLGNSIKEAEADMKVRKVERKQIWNNKQEARSLSLVRKNKRRPSRSLFAQHGAMNS